MHAPRINNDARGEAVPVTLALIQLDEVERRDDPGDHSHYVKPANQQQDPVVPDNRHRHQPLALEAGSLAQCVGTGLVTTEEIAFIRMDGLAIGYHPASGHHDMICPMGTALNQRG